MGFGVFIHRTDSIYDDSPAERYQFPRQYLGRVQACIGDWIVYYEPKKVSETRGYFAVARVQQVIPDPSVSNVFLALMEPGSYLEFPTSVPFADGGGPIERGVLNEQGRISGRAQSAVRTLSNSDFRRIVELGLEDGVPLLPRLDGPAPGSGFQEEQDPFQFDEQRQRANFTVSRIIRDRVFRQIVLKAYDQRCALSGLRLINGGGRAEVVAAPIRPVEAGGPDIVNDGIALLGTAHWMFDRGLISLSDDLQILVSRQANDPDAVREFINVSGRALPPLREFQRPHPHFLSWHRENCFKK